MKCAKTRNRRQLRRLDNFICNLNNDAVVASLMWCKVWRN